MITKIEVNNAVMFEDSAPAIDDLRTVNYFFGANGTGKTTISRIIEDPSSHLGCNVQWKNDNIMEVRVYNRDFVERNFRQQIPGVFTLGEQGADVVQKIDQIKREITALNDDIANRKNTLQGDNGQGGKKHELEQLEERYAERFWTVQKKHRGKLGDGFQGYLGSKNAFKDKVICEAETNTSDLLALAELESSAKTIYSDELATVHAIEAIKPQRLLFLESSPILAKRVIGKADVDIAALVNKLNNSDWVRQGLPYYEASGGVCPFCQQETDKDFAKSLNEYFDEAFEQDKKAIKALIADYAAESDSIQQQVQAVIDLRSMFIENEKLEAKKKLLDSAIAINVRQIDLKEKEASRVFEFDSLKSILDEIVSLITDANVKIEDHNNIVGNILREKEKLKGQIWRFIVEELESDISDYIEARDNLNSAIDNLQRQLQSKEEEKQAKKRTFHELEKQDVGIQSTLDGINNLLASFGFTNFSLADGGDGQTYRLVRANGSDAQETLSEGERNFVTVLYFFHWLKGSHDESGTTDDKIVVFDDPVSSLDSNILFVVSSLIRELYGDLHCGKGAIKQLFILTHNIYFHKEVAYDRRRGKGDVKKEESFWLIKKRGAESFVERQTTNPIKTSYEMLWEEVKETPEKRNKATIQNTLRRILENYFKLLGGISLDELYAYFEGDDMIKCKDLCSWVNDGSHSGGIFSDEYYTMPDDETVEKYLIVFKEIFVRSGHQAHYDMMMRGLVSGVEQQEEQADG